MCVSIQLKYISLDLSCVLQIEVSELYFVPDAGASRDQCEPPFFKPVSAYDIQTESVVSRVMFSSKTLLTFYDTFSTFSLVRTSFLVSIVTRDDEVHGSHSLRDLLECAITNCKYVRRSYRFITDKDNSMLTVTKSVFFEEQA